MFSPAPNADASVVAFESTCDLTAGNADGNREIFAVNDAGNVTQLTDTSGCANANPSVGFDGGAIAFDSDCDFDGGNTDASVEVFLWKASGIVQLTDATFCTSAAPSINAAGTRVAFDSDCDHVAGHNPDRSSEIFRSTAAGAVTQLTDDRTGSGCGSFAASSDASGDLISFESDCDLAGENPDAVSEIFQVNASGTVTQLTTSPDDTCASTNPASDSDGSIVAFESDCDYTGGNANGVVEIFSVTSGGAVTQLTSDPSGGPCESSAPAISEDGSAVVFESFCDLVDGGNADGSFEVYRARAGSVEQLTDSEQCSSVAPATRFSGNLVAWVSDCDLTGDNADGSDEVFLSSDPCACGAPVTRYGNGTEPLASDALFALRAAVGIGICALCDCDVNSDNKITASDALSILKRAVGQDVPLVCG